jgi:hypothetical protein
VKIKEIVKIYEELCMERYSAYDIKKALSKIENAGLILEVDPNSVEAYNFRPLEIFLGGKLSDMIGIDGITVQSTFFGNPKIFVLNYSNEVILPHELVHYEFFIKHEGRKELKKLADKYCGPLIRFLNGEDVDVKDIPITIFKLPRYIEKFHELHKDLFELGEAYAWLVTKKIRPDIEIPSVYDEDLIDTVKKYNFLPLEKIRSNIYKSYSLEDFVNRLNSNF